MNQSTMMNGANSLMWTVVLQVFFATFSQQICHQGSWQKLNRVPRCIGAKNDHYSTLRYHGPSKFMAAVKFVHVSGQIRCRPGPVHNSNWGCKQKVYASLNIFLTDWKNHVIFPREKHVTFLSAGKWYGLPGFDGDARVLVLSDFANPFYLSVDQRMRIWYGEDLFDVSEGDNHGRVCMDIYGYLM